MRKHLTVSALLASICLGLGPAQGAGLSAYSYVELTKESISAHLALLAQLDGEIRQYRGAPEGWAQQEAQIQAAFSEQQQQLYERYAVSPEQYASFYPGNKTWVERYLRAHPKDQARIDTLSAELGAAIEGYETLKSRVMNGALQELKGWYREERQPQSDWLGPEPQSSRSRRALSSTTRPKAFKHPRRLGKIRASAGVIK